MSDRNEREFNEWFHAMWSELVGVPTAPDLVHFKNELWLAIRERELKLAAGEE